MALLDVAKYLVFLLLMYLSTWKSKRQDLASRLTLGKVHGDLAPLPPLVPTGTSQQLDSFFYKFLRPRSFFTKFFFVISSM